MLNSYRTSVSTEKVSQHLGNPQDLGSCHRELHCISPTQRHVRSNSQRFHFVRTLVICMRPCSPPPPTVWGLQELSCIAMDAIIMGGTSKRIVSYTHSGLSA